MGTFSGLSSALMPVGGIDGKGNPESAIHLHNAPAGQGGGIIRNLTVIDNETERAVTQDASRSPTRKLPICAQTRSM